MSDRSRTAAARALVLERAAARRAKYGVRVDLSALRLELVAREVELVEVD